MTKPEATPPTGDKTTNPFNTGKIYEEPLRELPPLENTNPFISANPFNTNKIYKEPKLPIENIRVTQEGEDTVVRIPTAALRRTARSIKSTSGGRKRNGKTGKNKNVRRNVRP